MPIYEYACPDCGHKFDVLQKMSDPLVTVCPVCSGDHVRKLISATNFVLKGGGWYKDHYGLKPGGASEGSDSPAPVKVDAGKSEGGKSEGGKSDGSKTDAAPAAPSPAPAAPTTGSSGGSSSATP